MFLKPQKNKIELVRTNSRNEAFSDLISLLDQDLQTRYGRIQDQYKQFNKIDLIDTVVVAFVDKSPAGCGCFKYFDNTGAEIKRMFVKPEFRGLGLATMILKELEKWIVEKGFSVSMLETGIKQFEAINLYTKLGYERSENYGQYIGNHNSICMRKIL